MANRFDSMLAHGKGAVKQFQARLEGLVGVFATLARQHGEVTALLERCRGHRDRRAALWPEIRKQLLAHERSEMRVLYPELRLHDATRTLADHHDEEARELEGMIGKLDAEPIDSEVWGQLFDKLIEDVVFHAREEEKQIFPAAQKTLGDARSRALEPTLVAANRQMIDAV
jgi:hemerythrin superfamily protein